jgi:hypothetical protein
LEECELLDTDRLSTEGLDVCDDRSSNLGVLETERLDALREKLEECELLATERLSTEGFDVWDDRSSDLELLETESITLDRLEADMSDFFEDFPVEYERVESELLSEERLEDVAARLDLFDCFGSDLLSVVIFEDAME